MRHATRERYAFVAILCVAPLLGASYARAANGGAKPIGMRSDSMAEPLGVDTVAAVLSWRLVDDRQGALQTAYEITVSSTSSGKSDVWGSGRVASSQSAWVAYGGPRFQPSHRYLWCVQVWDKDGKPYLINDVSWWDTGLMGATNWNAKRIGHEYEELHSLWTSGAQGFTNAKVEGYAAKGDTHHDFRLPFSRSKPVVRADLYTTGEDATAAWGALYELSAGSYKFKAKLVARRTSATVTGTN